MSGESQQQPKTSFAGKGVYPVQHAHWLVNPLRNLVGPASRVVSRLDLKPRDQVLEIGCGPGYFSVPVARRVPQGKLVLFDLQPGMIELARKRLLAQRLTNFECHTGSATALPFADASFDVAFMVTVLGEVGNRDARAAAVREAARVLKSGGLFSVTEQFGDPDYVRVPELEAYASETGLRAVHRYGPRFFYTYNFRKA
ncbi:MAG TPA: methyltransferase domain-containing protein [Rhizomicrobium sp.]|nr:methyltransferase domain-containing protein [Rhizomicrobium sp.]